MSTQAATYTHRRPRAFALVLLFVLALLLAQTLAFVHRVVHHTSAPHLLAAQMKAPGAAAAGHSLAAPAFKLQGLMGKLFQHNESDPTCRVFDQAGSADALICPLAVVLPVAVPASVFLFFEGEVIARQAALFDARGPPSVR
jgi:hypothetical protein